MKVVPLFLVAACLAQGAQEPSQDSGQVKHRLAEIQLRLSTVDQQLSALKKRRKGVLVELQAIALERDRVRAQSEEADLKHAQTQLDIQNLTARKEVIQQEIQRRRTELRKQVRWMQAMGPLGELSFFSSLTNLEEYVLQGRYQVFLRNQERRRLDQIQQLRSELSRREGELTQASQRLMEESNEAGRLAANLKMQEERLTAFLDGLGQDEVRQKDIHAELAEEALQLERMLSQLFGKQKAETFESPSSFAALRGSLPQPAPGSLVQTYGEHLHPQFHTKTMQTGLLIAAPSGTPVLAVAEGKVVFVDIYQSFGPMVILDHGNGFYTLYSHLQGLAVAKGQILKQGESVGTVGTTVDGPRLGFEIRHQTQPQDPNPWFKQRYRASGSEHPRKSR